MSLGKDSGTADDSAEDVLEDADSDGFMSDEDCNDFNEDIHPGAVEVCDDRDNDCDGQVDEEGADGGTNWFRDADEDGFGTDGDITSACTAPAGYVAVDGDCDDEDPAFHPGAAEADCTDPSDYNCDGSVGFIDGDGDGYAACEDCDDSVQLIHPGAPELCNGLDDDCDGESDGGTASDPLTWYADADGDRYGNAEESVDACVAPEGYVADATDCDDGAAAAHPGATEICNDVDDDCDTLVDDDDDSLSGVPTWYYDADGDGHGNAAYTRIACDQPASYVAASNDCDDARASTYPGAPETCNGIDDDCDGDADDDPTDGDIYPEDADGDGFGSATATVVACDGVDNALDCDDTDATEPVVVDAEYGWSGGSGTTAAPYDTLARGVSEASRCVVANPGTYMEALDFDGKDLVISSTDGSAVTTIDASGSTTAVVTAATGESAELRGFTLTGGAGNQEETSTSYSCGSGCVGYHYFTTVCGGGVYADGSSLILDDLVVTENVLPENSFEETSTYDDETVYSFGGGICASGATVDGTNLIIQGNYAYNGGGAYAFDASVLTLDASVVVDNSAEEGAGAEADGADINLTNVILAWNMAGATGGGAKVASGALSLMNTTLDHNEASSAAGLYVGAAGSASVVNTLLTNGEDGAGIVVSTGSVSISFSDVYGNDGGAYSGMSDATGSRGNVAVDPLYSSVSEDGDWTNDDWSLRSTSTVIDQGNPSSALDDADGTVNDMGAYGGPGAEWTY